MRRQKEIEAELEKLGKIFSHLYGTDKNSPAMFSMGAVHALDWVLDKKDAPAISELDFFKRILENSKKSS